MKLSEFSAKNPFLINLATIFVWAAGVTALFRMPQDVFPSVDYDIVMVKTPYPGASAQQIEKLITHPLEEELKGVQDIKQTDSASSEGLSLIFLTIEEDAKNKDRVVNEIQRAVDRTDDLPDDLVDRPVVEEFRTRDDPAIEMSIAGPLPQLELQELAKRLKDRLLEIPDVSDVVLRGYYEPQFHVSISPEKLAEFHLSLTQVGEALARHNVNIPGGSLIDPTGEMTIRTTGEFLTAGEIGKVVVRANDQGNPVTIANLGEVILSHERPSVLFRADGKPAIILMPTKKEMKDIFKLRKALDEEIVKFEKTLPSGVQVSILHDMSYYVKRRLNVLRNNGLIGFFLIMVPLFLFLSRSTALSAIVGMPTAFFAAIAFMNFFGYSFNLVSMFGLVIVIGMLIDEDIVIAENIHRLVQEGKGFLEATIYGTAQVTKAVVATVATTITAFLPLFLMTGIMGRIVRDIPATVIMALVASLVEALVILPGHIYALSRMEKKHVIGTQFHERFLTEHFIERYGRMLRYCIARRYKILAFFVVSVILSGVVWHAKIHVVLFPKKGIEAFFVRGRLPVGTPLAVTADKMKLLEEKMKLLRADELKHYATYVGIAQNDPTDPFTQRGTHLGQIAVYLTPEPDRDRTVEEIVDALRPEVEKIGGFESVGIESFQPGPPIGKPVAIRFKGDDFEKLSSLAEKTKSLLKKVDGVTDIDDDHERGKMEQRVEIDAARTAQAGLSVAQVATAVRYAFEGGVATTVRASDEEWDVVVKFPESLRYDPTSLRKVVISNEVGNLIPLSAVARFGEQESLRVIRHLDRDRVITVSAQVDQRVTTSSQVISRMKNWLDPELEREGDLFVHYGGEAEETDESMQSFYRAFGLALLLIYIIIAVTVTDAISPFIVMTTILLGLIGVLIGFLLKGEPVTFLAMLGVVAMAGVVVDVALLILDFVHKKDQEGLSPHEAVIEGAKVRIRPIILTNATTLLGIIPAAIGLGGVDPFIQPMAYAMNWGIGFGTASALFVIPVLLAILRDFNLGIATKREV